MSFSQFPDSDDGIKLLQRSLERKRVGHAYLFSGDDLEHLQAVARTLAKTLNCQHPSQTLDGPDCCDQCPSCRKIEAANHPDVQWVRPESKSRVIIIEQIRELLQTVYLKPTEALFKVAIVVCADRLNANAANAFLKTLEEPPARSVLILLSTEPGRLLETILSRCLRLNFTGTGARFQDEALLSWLKQFSEAAVAEQGSLLSRYRLLSVLLGRLGALKQAIESDLTARSPLEKYDDLDPKLREKWEDELAAAIEAEYRRQRADVLTALQFWLRDLWLTTLGNGSLLTFRDLKPVTEALAARVDAVAASGNLRVIERLQRQLNSNVQEALALEVGLLQLKLG